MTSRRRWIVLSSGLVLMAIGAMYLYLTENYHPIVEGKAYRCAQPTPQFLTRVKQEQGIRSVINLRGAWAGEPWYQQEVAAVKRLGLNYYEIPITSYTLASPRDLRRLVKVYDTCPKPFLVHCRQGADRTSLAAAIYLILFECRTPDEAREAYKLRYGHTGFAVGSHLPHLFDEYQQWLEDFEYRHSAPRFRQWIGQLQTVAYFGASYRTPTEFPDQWEVGRPISLQLLVTNRSSEPWRVSDYPSEGVHLIVQQKLKSGERLVEVTATTSPGTVEPGQTVAMEADLPGFAQPGEYILHADLVDRRGMHFCRMGPYPWRQKIKVVAFRQPVALSRETSHR